LEGSLSGIGNIPVARILACSEVCVKAPHVGAMPELFGEKLRRLRRQHNLSQARLAEQLALASHSHIGKLETRQDTPSLALVLRIALRFEVSTDYLLRDTVAVDDIIPFPADRPDQDGERQIDGQPIGVAEYYPGYVVWPPALFSSKLRALRLQHRLTQEELMRRLGLARQSHISSLEAGRKAPSIDLIVRIADLFGVTTDELLRDTIAVGQGAPSRDGEIP